MSKIILILLCSLQVHAQFGAAQFQAIDSDELNVGGDIFSDFNEDLEASQVFEDERFYRYGRFYSFSLSTGVTTYTGNRGRAYDDDHPSLGLGLTFFINFRVAFGLGVAYSKHFFVLTDRVVGFNLEQGPGLIEVNMFRTYLSLRYYIDTYDLGTAVTYSNPYLIGRIEFWNQTNKFIDQISLANDSNGAIGASFGGGLEFPIEIRHSYLSVEMLYHFVNYRDTYTQTYRAAEEGGSGFDDLEGHAITFFTGYVISW